MCFFHRLQKNAVSHLREYSFFDLYYIKRSAKYRHNLIIDVIPISFRSFLPKDSSKYNIIENIVPRIVYEPPIWPEKNGTTHEFLSPGPIYLTEYSNVTVVGGTGLVLTEDNNYAMTDLCEFDDPEHINWCIGEIRRGNKDKLYIEVSKQIKDLDICLNLCGVGSNNYYHLTFEILSRYAYYKDNMKYGTIPILMDDDAKKHPQFVEMTNCIVGDAPIIYISKCQRIKCKKLIYPSMNTWMPNSLIGRKDRLSDYIIAESAITNIRKASEKNFLRPNDKKVFLSRGKSLNKRLQNDEDVAKAFETIGFEIVYTEEMSYKEQVQLFSSAKCIAGCGGAALTNLVYCSPGTLFILITSKHSGACLYSTIAHLVKCNVIQLETDETGNVDAMGNSYVMNMVKCNQFLNELKTIYENDN